MNNNLKATKRITKTAGDLNVLKSKGFKITFTKNGEYKTKFDTSTKVSRFFGQTNKDVAYYIATEIFGYDYRTDTFDNF